jgi:hypothetical protein
VNPIPVGNDEISQVLAAGGKYCPETLEALDTSKADHVHVDASGGVFGHEHKLQGHDKPLGIRDALLDTLNSRLEVVSKRRADRQRLREAEQAAALGLEPGDRVGQRVPNRAQMRFNSTNAARNGKVMGRPAARRKSHASIYTHRAVVVGEVTLRVGIGQPIQTGVAMRKRDRVRLAAGR